MKLDYLMLAGAAEARDGLVHIISGSWDTASRDSYPSLFVGAVVARVIVDANEVGPHEITLTWTDDNGAEIAPKAQFPVMVNPPPKDAPAGWENSMVMAATVHGIPIPAAGLYRLEFRVDGQLLKVQRFRFVQTVG